MINKVSIVGTVGIPAKYGGFETLVEYLTKYVGHELDITVFCSKKAYNETHVSHNDANLKYVNLKANGIQSIPYDIISLFQAARISDTILVLGVSGCIALPIFRLFYPKKKLVINIDGLEHRRNKWKKSIQKFLKFSEKLAVKYGDTIVSDNKGIQDYVFSEYGKDSCLIAYGGDHATIEELSEHVVSKYNIPSEYAFKVCRIEPENNIHLVLEAFKESQLPLVIIGNWDNSEYGLELKQEYAVFDSIIMLDPIYDQNILNQIRSNCSVYVHGHSAGGTNPSLVEAMSLSLPIVAFDVCYNRETTHNEALYFSSPLELQQTIQDLNKNALIALAGKMKKIADENYTWEKISVQYFNLLQ